MSLTIQHVNPTGDLNKLVFYSPSYLQSNYPFQVHSFDIYQKGILVGTFCFKSENGVATSLSRASFGGIELFIDASDFDYEECYNLIIQELTRSHTKLQITLPPIAYSLNAKSQHDALLQHAISTTTDINYHINICPDLFRNGIAPAEKNKLNKSKRAEHYFKLLPKERLKESFDLVQENRLFKGYTLSMDFTSLESIVTKSDAFVLFGLFDKDTLIATSISVQVLSDTLYNFYMADKQEYRGYSPLVHLNEHIYSYCQEKEFKVLDLGTASLDGQLNEGLAAFKKHLGAKESPKHHITLSL